MEDKRTGGAMEEFKAFILKGNVVDLAVAVIIAIAFGAVIAAMVGGILMPLIAALVGQPSFDALTWTLNGSEILYGSFLTAVVSFLIIAASLFLVIKAIAKMQRPKVIDVDEPAPVSDEVKLLQEIRDSLQVRVRN